MARWQVSCIGEEVDCPMGQRDTPEEAIALADKLFAEAVPAATPFAFWAYDPKQSDILYMTEEVVPLVPGEAS